jgi:hypothetical protein
LQEALHLSEYPADATIEPVITPCLTINPQQLALC